MTVTEEVKKTEKIKLGSKVRILPAGDSPCMSEGDIACICYPEIFRQNDELALSDCNGHYWADFNDCGNPYVVADGIWCVGIPGVHFGILEENV